MVFDFKQFSHREKFVHRGKMKFLILKMISEKPRHGYEIMQEIEKKFKGFYCPSPGIIYPVLQMLDDMGYAKKKKDEGKKVYGITARGKKYLKENEDILPETEPLSELFNDDLISLGKDFAHLAHLIFGNRQLYHQDQKKIDEIFKIVQKAKNEVARILGE